MEPPIDFLIITPLPDERNAVLEKLTAAKLPPDGKDIRVYFGADLPFASPEGHDTSYKIIVTPLLGMGRIEAANATGDAIRRWQPRYILLVGIAGGYAKQGVRLGDVLISEQIADYELQKKTRAGDQIRWSVHRVDPQLLGATQNILDQSWMDRLSVKRPRRGRPQIRFGPICTGDKVIAANGLAEQHMDVWKKLIGVEMESGGVASAAFQAVTRPGFFMIRGVSDLADSQKDSPTVQRWRAYACDVAASFTIGLLQQGPVPQVSRTALPVTLSPESEPGVSACAIPKATIARPSPSANPGPPANGMNRLVAIRIAHAEENLEQVQGALNRAIDRRLEAKALYQEIGKLALKYESQVSLGALSIECQKMLNEYSLSGSPLEKLMEDVQQERQEFRQSLKGLQKNASNWSRKVINLATHKRETEKILSDKRRFLESIQDKNSTHPLPEPRELLRDIDAAKPLWGEHIEAVAGVILRDEGFDKGLCIFADSLIDICQRHPVFSRSATLNILGHESAPLRDLKYTIYFRFPTWSVWGLPLVASEFWHASSQELPNDVKWDDCFKKIPQANKQWAKKLVQVCLADTFATFVIGPSYAFACVLLLLSITSPEHRMRAETIFATLKHLSKDNKKEEFVDDLEDRWIEVSGPQDAANFSEDAEVIREMRIALLKFMPSELRYDGELWSSTKANLLQLLESSAQRWEDDKALFKSFRWFDKIGMPQIIHAGWLGRWRSSELHKEHISDLARRVEWLCHQVVERKRHAFQGGEGE